MSEVNELKKRIEFLEERVRMLRSIADPERHPFTYLALEADLRRSQVDDIFRLMDEVRLSLKMGTPISHHIFESRIYEIVPSRNGDYHFAESVVRTLNDSNQYTDVFEHMKKDGMNL